MFKILIRKLLKVYKSKKAQQLHCDCDNIHDSIQSHDLKKKLQQKRLQQKWLYVHA